MDNLGKLNLLVNSTGIKFLAGEEWKTKQSVPNIVADGERFTWELIRKRGASLLQGIPTVSELNENTQTKDGSRLKGKIHFYKNDKEGRYTMG